MEKFTWPEDKALSILLPILRPLLFNAVPGFQTPDALDRLRATDTNNVDNEPLFLIAALTWGFVNSGNPGSYATTLLYVCVACRYIHNFCLLAKPRIIRSLIFLPPLFATLFMASSVLLKN
jgi:uncharacterized MAPEG superfamily protein